MLAQQQAAKAFTGIHQIGYTYVIVVLEAYVGALSVHRLAGAMHLAVAA